MNTGPPVATATAVAVTTTTDPTTDASTSVTMPRVTIPAPTATTVAVTATMVPTTDANATDIDILAYRTADGYHAFGNANAPVVLTDYSDFF